MYFSPTRKIEDTLIILLGTGETVFSVSLAIMSETEGSVPRPNSKVQEATRNTGHRY